MSSKKYKNEDLEQFVEKLEEESLKPRIPLNNLEIINYKKPEIDLEQNDFKKSKIFENKTQQNLLKE